MKDLPRMICIMFVNGNWQGDRIVEAISFNVGFVSFRQYAQTLSTSRQTIFTMRQKLLYPRSGFYYNVLLSLRSSVHGAGA